MKKTLIWCLILVLVVTVSIVGTLAYLTATDEVTNVMAVDDASIEIVEYERVNTDDKNTNAAVQAFNNNKHLRPSVLANGATYAAPDASYNANLSVDNAGNAIKANYTYPIWNPNNITNEIDKMVFVKNTGDCNVYVRLCFAFEAGNYVRQARFKEMVHLNANETDWEWDWSETRLAEIDGTRCFIAWATYEHPVAPGELTDISLAQIALDYTAINDHARAFGDTYDVKVFAQGIQSDGFASAEIALAKGFDDTIPFKNVKFLEFTDLKTALHYLNADTNAAPLKGPGTKENHMVNSVTFGLTADHPEVVKNRDGVLVANEEGCSDFTAYAYYVSTNDGKYDVYVLADDWEIYAPKDCGELFYGMKSLTKVDTTNLNVSDTTSMYKMFAESPKLPFVDTTNWDVSSVERMFGMFQNCTKLNNIDVSGWNTTSLYDTQYMFFGCSNLTALDVSTWDVGGLTVASYMFRECSNLTYLDVSRWKVDNLTAVKEMFNGCGSLQKLDVSDWKLNKVESFNAMFQNCSSLVYLDVGKWTIDIAKNTSAMFNGCKNLKVLDVSNFDVSKVTEMQTMFKGCSSLKSLDLSTFKVDEVWKMASMFEGCSELVSLNLSNWNVGKVTDMSAMFADCAALPSSSISNISGWNVAKVATMENLFKGCSSFIEIDLSGWTTGSLTNTRYMFADCTNLKTIYVGGSDKWIMSGVNNSDFMFSGCDNLEGSNGTKIYLNYLDKTYARVDTAGTPGYLTLK